MENENIYDKIMELFGKVPENFSILEEQVDIKTQMSYFEDSKKVKAQKPKREDVLIRKEELFGKDTPFESQKEILVLLANLNDVEAFRIIEKFNKDVPNELKDWTALALQESRMNLESSLLNENQVIISTGLGGKGKKLRYFLALASKNENDFTELQEKLLKKELEFLIKKNNGEVESAEFAEGYCSMVALVPLNVSIKELIYMAIEECNHIGDFVSEKFVLTNVKIFSLAEIKESWDKIINTK